MGSDDTHQTGAVDFQEFYRERWSQLRASFAWASYLGIDADDVTQETMMRARKHYERFASPDELALWCRRVGTNIIRRQIRAAYRRWERPHPSPLTAVPDAMSSDAEEQAVENADLARTMATLHPRHAQVLLLDAAGHSREDIAKILDISPAAVGMLLQRARRAARARWAKVVAAFMVLGVRVRKMQQVPSDSTSALVASVVSISIVAALGSTNASEYARAMPNAGLTPTRVVTPKLDPSGGLPGSLRGVTRVAPIGAVHAARWFLGANVTKADPGSECVRATDLRVFCPQPITDRKGRDHICIKHTGRSCIGTGESVTPVCQDVRRNPAVDCQREGDPHWTFRRPTKQRTLGGLL